MTDTDGETKRYNEIRFVSIKWIERKKMLRKVQAGAKLLEKEIGKPLPVTLHEPVQLVKGGTKTDWEVKVHLPNLDEEDTLMLIAGLTYPATPQLDIHFVGDWVATAPRLY